MFGGSSMTELRCKNCGGTLTDSGEKYICEFCDSVFEKEPKVIEFSDPEFTYRDVEERHKKKVRQWNWDFHIDWRLQLLIWVLLSVILEVPMRFQYNFLIGCIIPLGILLISDIITLITRSGKSQLFSLIFCIIYYLIHMLVLSKVYNLGWTYASFLVIGFIIYDSVFHSKGGMYFEKTKV